MRLKQFLITNRMNVSFFLLLILILSCIPLIFINDIGWLIIPIVVALLLVVWVVYSSIAKNNLIEAEVIPKNHSDFAEDLEKVFKPNSELKKILAAYGISIALMIVLVVLCVAISPEMLARYTSSLSIFLFFTVAFTISYIFIRKRLK